MDRLLSTAPVFLPQASKVQRRAVTQIVHIQFFLACYTVGKKDLTVFLYDVDVCRDNRGQ